MRKLSLSLTLASMVALGGCTPSPMSPVTGSDTATAIGAPAIASFSPSQGTAGTVVTITGSGFDGQTPSNNLVLFNGVPGLVSAATATTLTVTVPEGGSFGTLTVTVNGKTATSADSYASQLGIRTVAGTWAPKSTSAANWQAPYRAMTIDAAGNLFVVAHYQHAVYKITPDGTISTVAGNGLRGYLGDGGSALSARLNNPAGVAMDASGNLYIADTNNHSIRKVTPDGTISTVAGNGSAGYSGDGGAATSAQLYEPLGMAVDASGNLYIADRQNHRIRKVTPDGTISTVAGNGNSGSSGDTGSALSAQLNYPQGVVVDAEGNLYIADTNNSRIRKVTPDGTISTIAGNGNSGFSGDGGFATSAKLNYPKGVALDASGNLYIADSSTKRIRMVSATEGKISTVAGVGGGGGTGPESGPGNDLGDGGLATSAKLSNPQGMAVDASGNLYIADSDNYRIRKVNLAGDKMISSIAGNAAAEAVIGGGALNVSLAAPSGTAEDAQGNLYISDADRNVIWKLSNGNLSVVAGNGNYGYAGDGGAATSAQLRNPRGLAVDATGNLYIADRSNNRIRKVTPDGIISTVVGTESSGFSGDGGAATEAKLNDPRGVAVDAAGNLYIADTSNNRIRKVTPDGIISTVMGTDISGFAGDGGAATSAQLNYPHGVAVDASGNLYIADTDNNRIRKVSATDGKVSTVAGNGHAWDYGYGYRIAGYSAERQQATRTTLNYPSGVAVDASGNLYIADTDSHVIRKVTPDGTISTIAGSGIQGFMGDDGLASNARLNYPCGVMVSRSGNIIISDTDNGVIRTVGF